MYGVEIESRISADRNVGDERTGASEVCEEDGRYEEKDDFKICQQKAARTSPTLVYSTSCVFIPVIRPHLAQLQSKDLKHSFKLV